MAEMSDCLGNCTEFSCIEHEWSFTNIWTRLRILINSFEYHPWIFSFLGSAMVGLSGILPLLVIPINEAADLKHGDGAKVLKILLSFAVGGLLGDVFLHLLPEAWDNHVTTYMDKNINADQFSVGCGMWVLSGFLIFVIAEKLFNAENMSKYNNNKNTFNKNLNINIKSNSSSRHKNENNNCTSLHNLKDCSKIFKNIFINSEVMKVRNLRKDNQQNVLKNLSIDVKNYIKYPNYFVENNDGQMRQKNMNNRIADNSKHVSGYLNLIANSIDNFTHGLAIGGSFLVSLRLGFLTTFAILIHEIPHEIGDFAILLKSGFNRWDAAKAQVITATGGMFGAFVAVIFSNDAVESKTSWILPFTAGGFLHIGMVTLLPELLKETNTLESIKQIAALFSGIIVMTFLTIIYD